MTSEAKPSMVSPITSIAVTYLTVHPEGERFSRFGKLNTPAYLWYARGEEEPITEVKITYGDAEAGEGFTKLPENLNTANGSPVFLWYRKGGQGSPIIDMKVSTSFDPIVGPGFAKLDEQLNPEADKQQPKEYLAYKTRASQAKAEATDWQVGDELDALDTSNKWCVAQVMKVNEKGDLYVHYKGWSEKWDEWIPKKSNRLAPLRTKTLGAATGWEGDKDAFSMKDKFAEFQTVAKRLEEIMGKLNGQSIKALPREDNLFLCVNENHAYVLHCLNSIADDPAMVAAIQNFLQANLLLDIAAIKNEQDIPLALLEAVISIFGGNPKYTRFYSKYGVKSTDTTQPGDFAQRHVPANAGQSGEERTLTSIFLIDNINFFGARGGFDVLGERLNQNRDEDSFFAIAGLVKVLSSARAHLMPEFARDYIGKLDFEQLLLQRVRKITDTELKTLNKDSINEMVADVELLLSTAQDKAKTAEFIEKINLEISMRLLNSKVLAQQLKGCQELEDTIKKVARKERALAPAEGVPHAQKGPQAQFLSAQSLIEWIHQNQVVNVFLQSHSHEQIVKRSPILLKFLAQHNALKVEHVELLWASSIGKHEGLVRIVYDTLADLAQELNDEHLNALFQRLLAIPYTDYSDFVLSFIKAFTINAVKATQGKDEWFGLNIFWNLIQDEAKADATIAAHSLVLLKEMLENPMFESQRFVYLEKCVEGIRNGRSTLQCYRLAKLIISMFPPANKQQALTYTELIHKLQEKSQILDLVLHDCERYHTSQASDSKDKDDVAAASNAMLIRLDFINFLVSYSELSLSQQHIDVLWSLFMTGNNEQDKNLLLEWLAQAIDSSVKREYSPFSAEVARYVFTARLADPKAMDFAHLTLRGYQCLEAYFITVNYPACLATTSRKFMVVVDFANLIGLDALWRAALLIEDSKVAAVVRHFLTTIHIRLDHRYSAEDKKKVFEDFVVRSLSNLSENLVALRAGGSSNAHVASAVVDLLEGFLLRCEKGETIEKPKFAMGEAVRATWKNGAKFYDAKVEAVNADGTYHLHYADGDVDHHTPENVIKPAVGKPETEQPVMSPEHEAAMRYPLLILSNNRQYFDLFFELLEAGDSQVGAKVWRLIDRLPTNQTLSQKILTLESKDASGQQDWSTIFPTKFIKLLYSLQIMDKNKLMDKLDGEDQKEQQQRMLEWNQALVAKGGFHHIYSILSSVDAKLMLSDTLHQQCLGLLIKLVAHILSLSAGEEPVLRVEGVDAASFLPRLLSIVQAIAEAEQSEIHLAVSRPSVPDAPQRSGSFVGPLLPQQRAVQPYKPQPQPPAARDPQLDSPWIKLLERGFELISSSVASDPALLATVEEFPGWRATLLSGLVLNPNAYLRHSFSSCIFDYCKRFNASPRAPRLFFLRVLIDCLPEVRSDSHRAAAYFILLQSILRSTKVEDNVVDPKQLVVMLAQRIKAHPVLERRSEDEDLVLSGLMKITRELLINFPALKAELGLEHGLVDELYHCLFDVPSTEKSGAVPPPKCKSARLRKESFALLEELVRDCPDNFQLMGKLFAPNHLVSHSGGLVPRFWAFEAKTEEKSETGYVGLKNLGCICYINACLQQLFMIPKLRANVLAVDTDKEEDKKESLLYQFQYLMAALQETEKQYYNPFDFCYSFKDFDGNPTNVSIQDDAGGFMTRLVDSIHEKLKGGPYAHAFADVMGGAFSHELIGKGCPHYKEREEEFFAVTLPVENKKNIHESLQSFVQGEMLEGDNAFRCGQCNKKVDTLKRTCLKRLPPTMAFILKRFNLDYTTFQTTKLNDRLEFPETLNLKPYCKESLGLPPRDPASPTASPPADADSNSNDGTDSSDGKAAEDGKAEQTEEEQRPDSYYEYELRGMVVHTGGASHGHYYSFIRERLEDGTEAKWFEFNDNIVRPFDPKYIEDECFGGVDGRTGTEKSRSAYILFYDRKKPVEEPSVQSVTTDLSKLNVNNKDKNRAPVNSKIFSQIWQQNITYWRDKAVFDGDYFDFLWRVLPDEKEQEAIDKELDPAGSHSAAVSASASVAEGATLSSAFAPEASNILKFATYFVFNTLTRALNKQKLGHWMVYLKRQYAQNVNACAWLLQTAASNTWYSDFLWRCPDEFARNAVLDLFCVAFSAVAPLEQHTFLNPQPLLPPADKDAKKEEEEVKEAESRGILVAFVDRVVPEFMREAPTWWKFFDPAFKLLAHFAALGLLEAHYLEKRHSMVLRLIDFYVGDESSVPINGIAVDSKGRRKVMRDNYTIPDSSPLLVLLRNLVCAHSTEAKEQPPTLRPLNPVHHKSADGTPIVSELAASARAEPLSDQTVALLYPFVANRMVNEASSRRRGVIVGDIFAHICWENEKQAQTVVAIVTDSLERSSSPEYMRAPFRVLMRLVLMQDSLQTLRVEWTMSSLLQVMKMQAQYWRVTDYCTEHLIRMVKKSPACLAWLQERPQSYEWIIKWLMDNEVPPRVHENGPVVLNKPGVHNGHYNMYNVGPIGLPIRAKRQALALIKDGQPLDTNNASDSDIDLNEREFVLHELVDARDTANKWLPGSVVEVNGCRAKVSFKGWDSKWDQWYDMSSPDLMRANTKCAHTVDDSSLDLNNKKRRAAHPI